MGIDTTFLNTIGCKLSNLRPRLRRGGWLLFALLSLLPGFLLAPTVLADGPVPLPPAPDSLITAFRIDNGAWGDLDNDGDLDLVVSGANLLQVYTNNGLDAQGNLQLVPGQRFTGGLFSRPVLADANGDGALDVAVAKGHRLEKDKVLIYLNDGQGGLTPTPGWESPITNHNTVVTWGDVNGDGRPDLAVGHSEYTRPLSDTIYLNTSSNNQLQFSQDWSNDSDFDQFTNAMAWGDMDQDGDLDLAVAGDRRWHVFENSGDRLRSTPIITGVLGINDKFSDVAWGDVDGNGQLELAVKSVKEYEAPVDQPPPPGVVLASSRSVELYSITQVNGGWQAERVWAAPQATNGGTMRWGDVDNDGDLDLAVEREAEAALLFLNVNGALQTSPAWQSSGKSLTGSSEWVDVDNDGDLDLSAFGFGSAAVFLNRGRGLPTTPPVTSAPNQNASLSLAWGDVDGDGRLELAAGTARGDSGLFPWDRWDAAPNFIYRLQSDNGRQQLTPAAALWQPATERATLSLAWGDIDGDGDLDLAAGNRRAANGASGANEIYLNNNGSLAANPAFTFGGDNDISLALAWGDADGDGDLDLAVGNHNSASQVFINEQGTFNNVLTLERGPTTSLAWVDIDGDSDLDLATGEFRPGLPTEAQQVKIYLNAGGRLATRPAYALTHVPVYSLAFGDANGDGRPDLAVGTHGAPSRIYFNNNGVLADSPGWQATEIDHRPVVAWGDISGDGYPDLAVATGFNESLGLTTNNKIYLNQRGQLARSASWISQVSVRGDFATSLAFGDANVDGRLDLAIGVASNRNFSDVDALYLNQGLTEPLTLTQPAVSLGLTSDPVVTVDNQISSALAPANFHATPAVRNSGVVPISYTLTHPGGRAFRFVRGFYSPDGGGQWFPAIITGPTTIAKTNSVTLTNASVAGEFTYNGVFRWDVPASGFLGQSDNVVFRLEAYPAYGLPPGSTTNSFQRAVVSAQTYPFRVRGTQVQVISGTTPVSGALVYRLPAGKSVGGAALRGVTPFITDRNGYLQGRGQIAPKDQLLALAPQPLPAAYRARYGNTLALYLTNGTPTASGLEVTTVTGGGVQQLTVSPDYPLMLFDLDVTLEWDASNDPAYLSQLEFDLRRASAHLYDFTDGQVALGDIYVFQNADRWANSHILVHSTNRLRPYATVGGVVITATAALSPTQGITYTIGQVHMGATWNRYGNPAQSIGVDWPVILAHELGHYLLFLEDTYLGLQQFDGAEVLVSVDSCTGSAMGDVYNINNTEFVQSPTDWQANCAGTLAAQELSRTEWDTITGHYPWLKSPRLTQPGPGLMPFELTTITIIDPISPANTLEDPTFYLDYRADEVSSSEARAFLLRNRSGTAAGIDAYEYVYDLGNPVGGQNRVLARGAAPGDRLCVFDQARRQFGCARVEPGRERMPLQKDDAWQPVITLSPVNSTTFAVRVDGVTLAAGQQLQARLYPDFGSAFTITQLSPLAGGYAGTLALDYPALKGHVQVWVNNDPRVPRREAIVAYRVGGNPGSERGSGGSERGSGGSERGSGGSERGSGGSERGSGGSERGSGGSERGSGGSERGSGGSERGSGGSERGSGGSERGSGGSERGSGANARGEGNAPAVSPDGQMIYFDRNYDLGEGQFYTVQMMAGLPPLPADKVAIGAGYNLFATGFTTGSLTGSVSFQYRGNDVLAEERSENELGIHFWDNQQWRALNTTVDTTYNMASARSQGPGIYALLAGVTAPQIQTVAPVTVPNSSAATFTIIGENFLPPVAAQLVGTDSSLPLTPTAVTSTSVTLAVPAQLPAGSYRVRMNNRNQSLTATTTSAVVRVVDPAATVCFADDFERGPAQWLRSGEMALSELVPGGNQTMSGSGPADTIISDPIDLSGCLNPQLSLRYAIENGTLPAAPITLVADVLLTGTSTSGQTVARYGSQVAGWQTTTVDLTPYAGQTIRLRFSSGGDSRRWWLDDVVVRGSP
jgi:hypothetical protein